MKKLKMGELVYSKAHGQGIVSDFGQSSFDTVSVYKWQEQGGNHHQFMDQSQG